MSGTIAGKILAKEDNIWANGRSLKRQIRRRQRKKIGLVSERLSILMEHFIKDSQKIISFTASVV